MSTFQRKCAAWRGSTRERSGGRPLGLGAAQVLRHRSKVAVALYVQYSFWHLLTLLQSVAEPKPLTKLVVVGGLDSNSRWHSDVQVIDVGEDERSGSRSGGDGIPNAAAPCWLPPVPVNSIRGPSAYIDDSVFVCTGSDRRCFRLNTTVADDYKWERAHFFQPRIRILPTAITM